MNWAKGLQAPELRHRWEMPMVWISVGISALALLLSGAVSVADLSGSLSDLPTEDQETLRELAQYGWIVVFGPLVIFVLRYFMASGARANAVRVGPQQFPALWAMYVDLANRLGVTELPRFYVTNGNGVVNAYALSCNTRHKYVVIHAEIAFLIDSQPKVVEFVLGHELAHHKLGHTSLFRAAIGAVPQFLVLPGRALVRSQEYSADRLALYHCPDCLEGCSFLGVGPFMAGQVNHEALYQQAVEDDRSLWVRLHNVLSDHAVLVKRFKALRDMQDKGLGEHGQMF